jgi:hypothetical protein
MTDIENPFIVSGYQGKAYFCDREKETKALIENITNGLSTTLVAIRRIGKTGLIRHVLNRLPKDHTGIYLDILPTENRKDLLDALTTSVFRTLPERSGPGKKIIDFIKSLRPVVTYEPLTGIPQVKIDVRPGETEQHIDAVLHYLDDYPRKVVIAIDEFQQILNYPETNTDAWLHSIIQSLHNIQFIFSGSQQHLMTDLFSNPSRPFYRSTGFLKLDKINSDAYETFIGHHFKKADTQINREVIKSMLSWTDRHTYYVQLLCNRVYAAAAKEVTEAFWKEQAAKLLQEQELIFFKYRDLLSKQQWLLLKSIAQEGRVYAPTSKDFVAAYKLGSPATVLRSLQALQQKEMIYSEYDPDGRMYYSVYDVLFRRWMDGR